VKAKCKFDKKENRTKNSCFFSISPLLYRKFSWASTIHKGIFPRGQALWADSASPQMNTIASYDKPIRIKENLGS